ncbi:phage virion morphogenesis protein [Brevibacillus thermoruber]|uniref:phage virion morphogenesis protein n=1 Tax=Brevibacillus thermoruber TaxID=33942 RepID=UPI00054E7A21|nr:phage virion morphogenesis protein [Brevibacillus thermoruber]
MSSAEFGDWKKAMGLISRLSDLDRLRLHKKIGSVMVDSTKERFKTGIAPDGSPWPKSKRAEREGGKTLVRKARLRNSITFRASARQVEWGTNVPYAKTHNNGEEIKEHVVQAKNRRSLRFFVNGQAIFRRKVTIPKFKMPKRQFIGLSEDDEREIREIIIGEIGEGYL